MSSNYPPGFGSARDLDYVEGPIDEIEVDDMCPSCFAQRATHGFAVVRVRTYWGASRLECRECGYEGSDEDDDDV